MGLRDSARYGVLERSDEPQGGLRLEQYSGYDRIHKCLLCIHEKDCEMS